jgi:Fe-S-cluster containining protein
MTSPCATCTKRCCHHYTVTVSGYDAWVIAQGLHLAPEQFLVAVPQKTPNRRGFLLDRSERTYDIALDKAPAASEEQPCVFWVGLPSGVGRCGIYGLRPFVCQTYPAWMVEGNVERREDVLCAPDAWRDGVLQRPVWRERLLQMHVEFDIYELAVARWNYHVLHAAHPAHISVPAYFTYLMNYYARLAPIRAGLDPATWQALGAAWGECYLRGVSPLMSGSPDLAPWAPVLDAILAVADSFFPGDLPPDTVPVATAPVGTPDVAGRN